MFKMNPSAKEFVPAHILKKRQEDADRLNELTDQLDKVELKANKDEESSGDKDEQKKSDSHSTQNNENAAKLETNNATQSSKQQQSHDDHQNHRREHQHSNSTNNNHNHSNDNNNRHETDYPEGLQDLIDEEDDRFLLNAGENICEFNGEQFIIPGDDEYEPPAQAGYDFGNAEDNEDEDVCNAFEQFLENLPDQ